MLKRCANCILPESYPGITFNEQGVCNHCLTHKKAECQGEPALLSVVEPYKNSNREYDCIVGISGGRDSAYVAHYAVRVLNLRVLAYTYDNGFMPEQTKENVENIVTLLGIDHVIEKQKYVQENIRRVIPCWIHKPSPAMVSFLCTGCRTGGMRGFVKTARNNKTPLVIMGEGEPERSFAEDLLSISTGVRSKKLSLILGFLREIIRNPHYVNRNCLAGFAQEFLYRYVHEYDKKVRMVQFFTFIEWNEKTIHSVIQKELKWRKPPHSRSSWRSDCRIHLLKQYLYRETLGFTKNDELLSGMIRDNMITREDALKRVENDNIISQQFLISFLDELGLNFSALDIALREYKKTIIERSA